MRAPRGTEDLGGTRDFTGCVASVWLCAHSCVHRWFAQSPESGLGQPQLATARAGEQASSASSWFSLHLPVWEMAPAALKTDLAVDVLPGPGPAHWDQCSRRLTQVLLPPSPPQPSPASQRSGPGLSEGRSFLETLSPCHLPARPGLVWSPP